MFENIFYYYNVCVFIVPENFKMSNLIHLKFELYRTLGF